MTVPEGVKVQRTYRVQITLPTWCWEELERAHEQWNLTGHQLIEQHLYHRCRELRAFRIGVTDDGAPPRDDEPAED